MEEDWVKAVIFKSEIIIQSIKDFWGESFVYSDTDVQFFQSTRSLIEQTLKDNDIVCQLDRPSGNLCTGFFALKANKRTLHLWDKVHEIILDESRDQIAFNRLIRSMDGISFAHLPKNFFGGGTFCDKRWEPGDPLFIPSNPVMHHANCTIGIRNKILQLEYVKNEVNSRQF